ncbi:IPT/TIG domain-containing protein [bacterium]|nr:IPT/TIG domain-containing protein [bacterium]
MQTRSLLTLLTLACLVGCQVGDPLSSANGKGPDQVAPSTVPSLSGTLQLPERTTLAVPADVLTAATVTLINPASNQAVTSALTDASGNFTIQFSGNFNPGIGSTYVLEAFKGLGSNAPGYYAPRFRTIIQLTAGGWTSITGTSIYINALTTAIAIESALDGTNVAAASTIAKITPPATLVTNAFAPHHPDAEVYQLASDISNYLTNNLDPLLSVSAVQPSVTSFNPTSGGAGTIVTLYGKGFNAVPGSTTVTFNGVPANVIYVAPRLDTPGQSRLAVICPPAFNTGKIEISTPVGTASTATNFTTNVPTLSGLSIATGSVGNTVTITGTNFDLNASNDIVRFNGMLAPVTAATATTLTCQVPVGASTGNVVVTTNAGPSNGLQFTVHPVISSLSRPSGPLGSTVVITGYNFDGATPFNNQVRFNGTLATVTASTPTSITCTVPPGATSGPLTVTVGAEASTAVTFYVVPNLSGNGTL